MKLKLTLCGRIMCVCSQTRTKHVNAPLGQNTDKFDIFLGAFEKLRKATISFMYVRPYGTNRLPPDGFCLNLIFEHFSKVYRENLSLIEIRQE